MYKRLLGTILLIMISGACNNAASEVVVHDDAGMVLQKNGHVQPVVSEIMRLLGCSDFPTRVDQFVEKLGPAFTRRPGQERWDMKRNIDAEVSNKILTKFNALGFFSSIEPKSKKYDYIVVLGGTLSSLRKRLSFVKHLWAQGVRGNSLVFLTGDRPLTDFENATKLGDREQVVLPISKSWQSPAEHPKNETELMREIWRQAELPAELAALPVVVVDTPQQTWLDGSIHRPNTGDTLVWWLKNQPSPGSCLFISNQPYVGYQGAVIRRWMPNNFSIETVGSDVLRDKESVSVLVDSLLRWLAFEAFHCKLWDEATLEKFLKQ